MADEKTKGSGTATVDSPGENIVQLTFLPEGKTVEFERDKLPYKDHGKEQSILDVALNYGVRLDHACGGNCACTSRLIVAKNCKPVRPRLFDGRVGWFLGRLRRRHGREKLERFDQLAIGGPDALEHWFFNRDGC